MVYDCFSFFNELDVLEVRLNVLKDVVDRFVIVEAIWTHTGRPKELLFEKNRQRYAEFLDKIIYVKLTEEPAFPEDATDVERAWIRENTQRNAILNGLKGASDDDYLIISDLDEVANPLVVKKIVQDRLGGIVSLRMRLYYYFLNFRNVSVPYWNHMPKMLRVSTFRSLGSYANPIYSTCAPLACNNPPSATLMRMAVPDFVMENGGWHFSFQGGVDMVLTKLASIVEGAEVISYNGGAEHLRDRIEQQIKCGRGVWGGNERFVAEPVELNLPKFIAENRARYVSMLIETNDEAYAKTWRLRWYAPKVRFLHDWLVSVAIRITPKRLVPLARLLRKKVGI